MCVEECPAILGSGGGFPGLGHGLLFGLGTVLETMAVSFSVLMC